MAFIVETGIQDVLAQLPKASSVSGSASTHSKVDILICAAGFEDRATAVLDYLKSVEIGLVVIIEYPTNQADNLNAADRFSTLESAHNCSVVRYTGTSQFSARISKLLQHLPNDSTVIVDISAMSSYVFFRLMPAILAQPKISLEVFYAEAAEYAPSVSEWQQFQVKAGRASGLEELLAFYSRYESRFQTGDTSVVYESEFFPGAESRGLPVELIALPSFSLDRIKSMLAFCEREMNARQDSVHWMIGAPPNEEKNGWRSEALVDLYRIREKSWIPVCTLNYERVLRALDEVWVQFGHKRKLVVASAGSKMQNLSILLFVTMHPDVALVLSEPEEFNAGRFSSGVGPQWSLKLGSIGELVRTLESRGDLRFEWRNEGPLKSDDTTTS